MDYTVVAERLVKRFGYTVALKGVTFTASKGLTLIVGPNGSGKTTLLKILAGLVKPTSGRVTVLGLNPWTERSRLMSRASIAIEGYPLPWWMNGRELARHVSRLWRVPLESLLESLQHLGVTGYWDKKIIGYSSGMRKRLSLALGLVGDRELYIVDEPFSNLDTGSVRAVVERINGLAMESSVIMATHIVPPGLSRIDRLLVLVDGEAFHGLEERAPILLVEARVASGEEARKIIDSVADAVPEAASRVYYAPKAGTVRMELSMAEAERIRRLLPGVQASIYVNPNLPQYVPFQRPTQ